MTLFVGLLPEYSCGAHPMQRGYPTLNRLAVDSVAPCARVEPDRALESSARHSPGDSNARSGPLAATETEAHVFQRSREGGSDMLRVRHIPGNGIPRKTGSKRGWQRETQNTSWIEQLLPQLRCKVAVKRQGLSSPIFLYKTVALVKLPFGMLRCAVAATLNRP